MKFETIAIHGGYSPETTTNSVAVPIYQTASYSFRDTQHGADLFGRWQNSEKYKHPFKIDLRGQLEDAKTLKSVKHSSKMDLRA